MKIDRRCFLAASAATVLSSDLRAQTRAALSPEDFGAVGDGVANDTPAFARLSAEIRRRGGGTVSLRAKRTYLVGQQAPDRAEWAWRPSPILDFRGLGGPLTILGNGARLRCAPGLRFGAFSKSDAPVHRSMPNYDHSLRASPYEAMILIEQCSGPVEVRDVELDGNLARLRIGGRYGDTGWQLPGTGLLLRGNSGREQVDNILSHHHAQDGAMIIGDPRRNKRSRITRLICRHNARQGLSITAGRGYDFADCEFSHSGRSAISSAPSAGVDIEAEGAIIRDLSFTRCRFLDNAGAGLIADNGDSADVRFGQCRFVGTTTWSAWPNRPRFHFDDCAFLGSVVHPFPSGDPRLACKFTNCRFSDDSKQSPTGQLFLGGGPIVNLAESDNVLFDGCRFQLVGKGLLPWSWKAVYRDCTMRQRSSTPAMTKGRYLGRTTIDGLVDLYGSVVEGTLVVNGKPIRRGPVG
jgi:hypothetical protein